jgi:hypothetical protein
MAVRLSSSNGNLPLPKERYRVFISVRDCIEPMVIVWLEGLGLLKKFNIIGNRTRDLQACSIVPQPTTLPPDSLMMLKIKWTKLKIKILNIR